MSQTPQPPQTPQAPEPQSPLPTQAPAPGRKSNGYSVAGLVLGIVSIVGFILWFIAVPAAFAGLVLSIIGVVRARAVGKGMGMGVAGIVLCAVGLLVMTPLGVVFLWFYSDMSQWVGESYQGIRSGTTTTGPANNLLPLWWWLTGL